MPETGFGSAADAAGQLEASLDYLAATDWASLGPQAHGEMLARLQRAQAQLTAVNAAVLAAFTAQSGYEPDGHRSAMALLVNRTKMSRGAAAGASAGSGGWPGTASSPPRWPPGKSPSPGVRTSPTGPSHCHRSSVTRPTRSCWKPPRPGCRWKTCGSWPGRSGRRGRRSTPTPTTATESQATLPT